MGAPFEIPSDLPPLELQVGPSGFLQAPAGPPPAQSFADKYVTPYQLPTPEELAKADAAAAVRPDLQPLRPGGVPATGTPALPSAPVEPPPFAPPLAGGPPAAGAPAAPARPRAAGPAAAQRGTAGPAAPGLEQQAQGATAAEIRAQGEQGDAQAQAAADQAQAYADAAKAHADQAAALQRQREVNAQAFRDAQATQEKALQQARDRVIPDFWEGREGSRVRSAIGMFLMTLGGGTAGAEAGHKIIQDQIDTYYREQKTKTDNLYKYAEARGKMTDDLRLQQASDLATLQLQHGATNLSVSDHIQEVVNASQGRVDKAKAATLQAQTQRQGVKDVTEAKESLAKIALMRAQANAANASAAHSRAAAGALGAGGAGKDEKFITAELDKDETRLRGSARSPGVLARADAAQASANDLRKAMASGDPQAIKVAVMHVKEQSSRFLTGSAPTAQTMKMNEDLKGTPAQVEARIAQLLGNPTEGTQFVQSMLQNIDTIHSQLEEQKNVERNNFVQKYHGPGGLASTPARKAAALGRGAALFGDDPTGASRPAAPAAPPPGATMGTLNGRRGYVVNGVFTPT